MRNSRQLEEGARGTRSAALLAWAMVLLCAQAALAGKSGSVMVHGASRSSGPNATSPVWIASNVTDPKDPGGVGTMILYREKIGEEKWQEWSRIAFTAADITNHSSDLVVVRENRTTWAWFFSSPTGQRFTYGPELPERQRMLAVAGDRKGLWALALPAAKPTQPATTRPATAPATRTAAPILYQLSGNVWTPHDAPLPAGVYFETPDQVSMAIINESPTLAINTGDRFIQLVQYSRAARRWDKVRDGRIEVEHPRPPQWFKLLSLAEQPAVWVWADVEGSLGHIWMPGGSIKLPDNPGIGPGDADVTAAGDTVWLVYRNNQGKLYQQRFGRDGTRDDQPTPVQWNRPQSGPAGNEWMTIVVMTVLTFLVLTALLRRRAAANKEEKDEPEE